MATTPPPRGRLRTPPAPAYGAGYATYSPYSGSPRRSKRLASQNETQYTSLEPQTPLSSDEKDQSDLDESSGCWKEIKHTSVHSHISLSSSAPGRGRIQHTSLHSQSSLSSAKGLQSGLGAIHHTSLQQSQSSLSSDEKTHLALDGNSHHLNDDLDDPLSSPNLTAKQGTIRNPKSQHNTLLFYAKNHTNKITKNTSSSLPSSHNPSEKSKQQPTMAAGMLPTPAKTPRKKNVQNPKAVARTLFTKPTQTMDTPSKRAKGKKYNGFSLESFHSDPQQAARGSIEIFTDVRDRIPTLNTAEDNPFVSHPNEIDALSDSDQPDEKGKRRKLSQGGGERDSEVDDMINRDDGMLYVFRGKKIFRRFKPDEVIDAHDSDDAGLLESVDDAPGDSGRRLTRSSIKPRILFPTPEQLRGRADKARATRETAIETDDEHMEEGEKPHQDNRAVMPEIINTPLTPPSKITRLATPSTPLASGRALRSHTKRAEADITPDNSGSPNGTHISPFDSWTRTKARASPATQGKKRSSSTLGRSNLRQSKKVYQAE